MKKIRNNFAKEMRNHLTLLFISLIGIASAFCEKPRTIPAKYNNRYELDKRVVRTIETVHKNIRDMNNDGKINCIDYATSFKIEWDKNYDPWKCIIVRNKNENTHMHHLFNRVRDNLNEDIYVEPWCWNPCKYTMDDNWDSTYDPKYNIENETYIWLREAGVKQ